MSSKTSSPLVAIIGLGYVGAPLAVAFARHHPTIGFDINHHRIAELRQGYDRTREISDEALEHEAEKNHLTLTSDAHDLKNADIFIVTVPTPITDANVPDMSYVIAASQTVAGVMKKGAIVVYESTVYPGATEEECLPVLQNVSGFAYPQDFAIAYSPERINPGDPVHTLATTTKIVSGDRPKVLDTLAHLYGQITSVYRAPSIKVAESAKILENVQRDVNIALMNEVYQIFSLFGIDTHAVLRAAGTKWNFLKFTPGLVGGHCISVDPYYLSHQATREGFSAELITTARRINDSMPAFIVNQLVKEMTKSIGLSSATVVTVLGITFKENVPDIRNSKVVDIVKELDKYGVHVQVIDPRAYADEVASELGLTLVSEAEAQANPADAVILAVPHDDFFLQDSWTFLSRLTKSTALVVDLKGKLDASEAPDKLTVV